MGSMEYQGNKGLSDTDQTIQVKGHDFMQSFVNLLTVSKIYDANNERVARCVDIFKKLSAFLMRESGELSLAITHGVVYLQEEKIFYQRNFITLFRKLAQYFEERQIDSLFFYPEVKDCRPDELVAFARLFNDCIKHKKPFVWLTIELNKENFNWVKLYKHEKPESMLDVLSEALEETDDIERQTAIKQKQKAISTYSCTMESLDEVAGKIVAGTGGSICKSVHLVQNMVDLILVNDTTLVGLSTIRDYDDYLFTHSVNVAILSIWLGQRIGLSRVSLERLGLSGLFHDLGKLDISKGVLNKPDKLQDKEYAALKRHTLNSVGRIIRLRTSYEKKAQILLAPFEHHLKFDLSGYPQSPRKTPQSLFSRIVAIADMYDAVTSPRVYRNTVWSPDKALGEMLKESNRSFDPVLLKVFVNMMGMYPVGTIIKLADERLGIVSEYESKNNEVARLQAVILESDGNEGYTKGESIDLGPLKPETCSFDIPIIQTLHPSDLNIQPAEFLL